MLALSVSMNFPPEVLPKVLEYLPELCRLSREDAGCVEYWWARSVEDPDTLRLYEVWESQEILQAHLQQPHEQEWMSKFQQQATNVKVFTYDPSAQGTMPTG